MEDEYYVPSLQEFHIGFEYEFHGMSGAGYVIMDMSDGGKILGEKKPDIKIWNEEVFQIFNGNVFDNFRNLSEIKTLIESEQIRIKYLDREDIESFGFDHDQTTKDGAYFCKGSMMDKNEWSLTAHNARKYDYTYLSIFDMNKKSDNSFCGVIKNKSELKRLLLQLQIIEP